MVDDADYERLAQHRWYASVGRGTFYAVRMIRRDDGSRSSLYMHRVIVGADETAKVDHRDGNGLNNQRRNIRAATSRENQQHMVRVRKRKSSRFKGVSWSSHARRWLARIGDGAKRPCGRAKMRYLGYFTDEEAAARAYDRAALASFGEFAATNFSDAPQVPAPSPES